MTSITTLMGILLRPVTLRIQPHRAIMRTLRHHKDRTILRHLAVHTLLTRATPVLRLFPTRVIHSYLFHFIIPLIVKRTIFTSTEEVMFSWWPVCLSVCVQNISNSYEQILMKFFGGVGRAQGRVD